MVSQADGPGHSPAYPAAPVDPAKGRGKYTLQISTFLTSAEADAFAQRFPGAFVISGPIPGKGTIYRVRYGNYGSFKEAATAKDDLLGIVGLLACIAFVVHSDQHAHRATAVYGGLAAGLAIGTIVWLCDRPSGRGQSLDVTDQGTFVGRLLALLSRFLFFLPVVGLVFTGIALYVNRRRSAGWPWLVSRITFALSALLSAVLGVMMLIAKGGQ